MDLMTTERANPRAFSRAALALLLFATLAVSTAYGVLLLLPLRIKEMGGSEADFGLTTAAAALPAAGTLGFLLRYPRRIPPSLLLCGGCLLYASAAAGVATIRSVGFALVALGLVLGTVWAVVYTVAPMVVSDRVQDAVRARYIGYVTGTIQVGFGLGPALGAWLHRAGLTYPAVWLVGAGLAAAGALLIAPVVTRSPGRGAPVAAQHQASRVRLAPALARVARSPAGTPLAMILLAACLFTALNSYQTTFAQSRGLSFEVFYGTYTVAVVVARLVLARVLPDAGSDRMVRLSTAGVAVAVIGFLLVGSSLLRYAAASALLGVAYGLALPALQARAVNLASADDRPRALPLAGLLFQVAILSFPIVAGAIIAAVGYRALFATLLALALALFLAGLRRSQRAMT